MEEAVIDYIGMKVGCSKHVFVFPFSKKETSLDAVLTQWDVKSNDVWQKGTDSAIEMYTEKQYFHKHAHRGMYDNVDGHLIQHFERKDTALGKVQYLITANGKDYFLKVDAININFYDSGVGILLIYCTNDRYNTFADVCEINQYGRRLVPPSAKYFGDMPNSIAIEGLECGTLKVEYELGKFQQGLDSNVDSSWKMPDLIRRLIGSLIGKIEIVPIVDDRMFVLCTCGCDTFSDLVKTNNYDKSHWYEYVFVDKPGDCSCQNDIMLDQLLDSATYTRWQKLGTIYGVSRYSFVELTSQWYLENMSYMTSLYTRMYELCIVQIASILNFAEIINKINNGKFSVSEFSKQVSDLYSRYIQFENSIALYSISEQDQGIELYDLIRNQMRIPEQVNYFDERLEELHRHAVFCVEEDRTRIEREKKELEKQRSGNIYTITSFVKIFAIPTFFMTIFTWILSMVKLTFPSIDSTDNYEMIAREVAIVIFLFALLFSVGKKKRLLFNSIIAISVILIVGFVMIDLLYFNIINI